MKKDSPYPGLVALLILAAIIMLVFFATSCGTGYPVAIKIHSDYGVASYSSKGGIEILIEK